MCLVAVKFGSGEQDVLRGRSSTFTQSDGGDGEAPASDSKDKVVRVPGE